MSEFDGRFNEIASNLIFNKNTKVRSRDIVQDMYLIIYEQIKRNKLATSDIIINGKPHYGIVKNMLNQLIIKKTKAQVNAISIDELFEDVKIEHNEPSFNYTIKENRVDEIVNTFYWFDKKLFNLYRKEFQSIRALSKATKISHVTCQQTIAKCKAIIKKKLQ